MSRPGPEAPLSPCVRRCGLDATRSYCVACLRTREEIMQWSRMSNDERREIMNDLPQRGPETKEVS